MKNPWQGKQLSTRKTFQGTRYLPVRCSAFPPVALEERNLWYLKKKKSQNSPTQKLQHPSAFHQRSARWVRGISKQIPSFPISGAVIHYNEFITCRDGPSFEIHRARCPAFKSFKEFQDHNSRALNHAQDLSKCGALCYCMGCIPRTLTLSRGSVPSLLFTCSNALSPWGAGGNLLSLPHKWPPTVVGSIKVWHWTCL